MSVTGGASGFRSQYSRTRSTEVIYKGNFYLHSRFGWKTKQTLIHLCIPEGNFKFSMVRGCAIFYDRVQIYGYRCQQFIIRLWFFVTIHLLVSLFGISGLMGMIFRKFSAFIGIIIGNFP